MVFIQKNVKLEWIYLFFLIYIIGLFIGSLINPLGFSYHINKQNQIYWLFCNSAVFLYFYIIRENKDFNILILKIFIFLIGIIAIKFLFDVYIEFFLEIYNRERVINFFYNIHSMSPNRLFLEQPVPRSSGLSRMTMLLFLFFYIQLFFLKKDKYRTIIYFIISSFLALTLFNLQNRVSVFFILILFFFTLFFKISDLSFKRKIIYALCIFLIPFLIHLNIQQVTLKIHKIVNAEQIEIRKKKEEIDKKNADKGLKERIVKAEEIKKEQIKETNAINRLKKQRILLKSSSGRKELWERTLKISVINNFIGYGPQADRAILGENVSSLYFYSLLCGGIISFIAIFVITIILFFKSIKMIFINNIFKSQELFTCFSILFIGYLYLRTIVEISFGIFGIDMILFFLFFNILRNSKNY